MSKAVELLVNSYVKLKERKALQHLLNGWQNTYGDLERRNSPKNILEGLAQEIEMIKAALDSLGGGDDATKTVRSSEVKVLGIGVSATPATANADLSPRTSESGGATSVVVTGLSIAVSPSAPAKRHHDG